MTPFACARGSIKNNYVSHACGATRDNCHNLIIVIAIKITGSQESTLNVRGNDKLVPDSQIIRRGIDLNKKPVPDLPSFTCRYISVTFVSNTLILYFNESNEMD